MKITVLSFIILLYSCGFATDKVLEYTNVNEINPVAYKYRKTVEGPCSFNVFVKTNIPDNYGHWKDNVHQMSALFGNSERSRYSLWNDLSISVPCAACISKDIRGMISVLDSKDHLVPWGCGQERPPLNTLKVNSSYFDLDSIPEDKWGNVSPITYEREYDPELISDPSFCDGEFVLFDLTTACEVLVDAGLIEKGY